MEENTRIMSFEQGWNSVQLQTALTKLKNILDGHSESQISPDDSFMAYTTIYNMCSHKPPYDYSQQLYDRYREIFEYYITTTVLPSLREKHDGFMLLSDFVRRWSNHKLMVKWLLRFFHYLDRHFASYISHPTLNEVASACFCDRVYEEVKGKVRDAVISLIDQERKCKPIDRALLKKVLETFVEIGKGQMEYYENDFESFMLEETSAYYSRKASNWISNKSFPDYMIKAEECLESEKDRASAYLHASSEPKLLEKVRHDLLSVYGIQLLEKESSGFLALLRDPDNNVGDLSRLYRLFSKIPWILDCISSMFKQHVTDETTTLAENPASNNKVFIRNVIELLNKYLTCVNDCFNNHTSFHRTLKDAFKVFCDMGVTGSSSAELHATFCDIILNKGGSEKLSEDTLRVVKLLAYVTDKDLFAEFYRNYKNDKK